MTTTFKEVYTHITKDIYLILIRVELINCLIEFIFKFINICPWMLIDIANQDIIFVIKGNYCIYTQTDSIRGISTIISDHRIDFKDLVTDVKCYSSPREITRFGDDTYQISCKICPIHGLTNTAINHTWLKKYSTALILLLLLPSGNFEPFYTLYTSEVFIQFPLPCPQFLCCDVKLTGSSYKKQEILTGQDKVS